MASVVRSKPPLKFLTGAVSLLAAASALISCGGSDQKAPPRDPLAAYALHVLSVQRDLDDAATAMFTAAVNPTTSADDGRGLAKHGQDVAAQAQHDLEKLSPPPGALTYHEALLQVAEHYERMFFIFRSDLDNFTESQGLDAAPLGETEATAREEEYRLAMVVLAAQPPSDLVTYVKAAARVQLTFATNARPDSIPTDPLSALVALDRARQATQVFAKQWDELTPSGGLASFYHSTVKASIQRSLREPLPGSIPEPSDEELTKQLFQSWTDTLRLTTMWDRLLLEALSA